LREAFEHLAAPERARLEAELPEAKKLHDDLHGRYAGHVHYEIAHPEALRRLDLLDVEISTAAWELDLDRQELDGVAAQPPQIQRPGRRVDRDLGLDRGIELEVGL